MTIAPYSDPVHRAVWLEGYEWALRNLNDEGVQADASRLRATAESEVAPVDPATADRPPGSVPAPARTSGDTPSEAVLAVQRALETYIDEYVAGGQEEPPDNRKCAELSVETVVGLLRELAPQWRSPDLMDAAACLEGTL